MWDGVDRRTQDRDLWAAIDPIEHRVTQIGERQRMTDEELFVLRQHCYEELFVLRQHCWECRLRRRPDLAVFLWALALGALAALVAALA